MKGLKFTATKQRATSTNAKLSRKLPVWKELLDLSIKGINIPIQSTTIRVHKYMPVVRYELRIDLDRMK